MNEIDSLKDSNGCLDFDSIKKVIPYDKPFIFVDKILNLEKGSIVGIKKIRADEEFFKGHFVDFPIMPGALMIEGLGQTATLLVRYNLPNHQEKDILAYKIKEASFTSPVFPGMEIRYEANLIAYDERGAVINGKIYSGNHLIANASFIVAIVDKNEFRKKVHLQSR